MIGRVESTHFTSMYIISFLRGNYFLLKLKGFPIRGFILIFKKNEYILKEINVYLFYCKEKGMPLTMENDIRQMAATATVAAPYPFHEIFHD